LIPRILPRPFKLTDTKLGDEVGAGVGTGVGSEGAGIGGKVEFGVGGGVGDDEGDSVGFGVVGPSVLSAPLISRNTAASDAVSPITARMRRSAGGTG
jgi:hypothetical protein